MLSEGFDLHIRLGTEGNFHSVYRLSEPPASTECWSRPAGLEWGSISWVISCHRTYQTRESHLLELCTGNVPSTNLSLMSHSSTLVYRLLHLRLPYFTSFSLFIHPRVPAYKSHVYAHTSTLTAAGKFSYLLYFILRTSRPIWCLDHGNSVSPVSTEDTDRTLPITPHGILSPAPSLCPLYKTSEKICISIMAIWASHMIQNFIFLIYYALPNNRIVLPPTKALIY